MKKLLAVLMLGISSHVWAIGEIIAVKTTGTQYCPGLKPFRFTPSSSTPIFLRLDNEWTVSAFLGSLKNTPDLMMNLQSDVIGARTASFSLGYYGDAYNHVEVIGRAKADKTGLVKTINGTFIRVGLTDGCYAVGKLTGKRIN
jgi:hypothetical protein